MSGETQSDESGFTVDTALVMINQRFRDLERLLDERHANNQRALQAALETAQREIIRTNSEVAVRFQSVNEFRGQLADQARTLMPRSESEATHAELRNRLEEMNTRLTAVNSRIDVDQGQNKGVTDQVAARRSSTAQVIALAAVFLTAISVAVGLILALN